MASQTDTNSRSNQATELTASLESLRVHVEQLRAEAERSQRLSLLGTMVGVIAHEFNNILTPVLSYCQLAKSRPDDAALTAKALDRAAAGAEKAARIATAILELTRDERLSGASRHSGLDEQPNSCDVRRAIEDTLLSMAREPAKDGIAVSIEGQGKTLARIRPIALHHILLNLVLNARKAMVGGGRLTFRYVGPSQSSTWNSPSRIDGEAEPAPDAGEWVLLEVEDTGCGIPSEILPKLFQPFATRSHESPAEITARGTGLGLAISKRLVEEAGGSIAAASESGIGTRFTLRLRAA